MKKATYLVLTMVVVAFAASYASAQRSVNVRFTRGQSEATFTNTVAAMAMSILSSTHGPASI